MLLIVAMTMNILTDFQVAATCHKSLVFQFYSVVLCLRPNWILNNVVVVCFFNASKLDKRLLSARSSM